MPLNLTQAIGFVAIICVLLSFQQNTRGRILIWLMLGQVLFTAHFGLLGATTAMATNLIAIARGVIFYFKPNYLWAKNPVWLYIFLAGIAVAGYFTWEGYRSLFVLGAMMLETVGLWGDRPRTIRRTMLAVRPIYFIYSLIVGSYAGMVADVIFSLSIIIGMIRFDRKTKPPATVR